MNWMTSAKNRIQRSKKKKEDNLRMIASSKLAPQNYGVQCKKSVILHDFGGREQQHEATRSVLRNNGQSNDVFMLNNLARTRTLALVDQASRVPSRSLSAVKPTADPLSLLEVSPPKALRHDSDGTQEPEEQSIIYYNNGELCDELGRLLISHTSSSSLQRELFAPISPAPTSPSATQSTAAQHTHGRNGRITTAGVHNAYTETGDAPAGVISRTDSNSFDSASPPHLLDGAAHDEWWFKMIAMLDGAKVDPALLRVVLQELCASQCTVPSVGAISASATGSVGYARSTLLGLPVPCPREALKGLYSALSKVGQDPKTSLVVFDVIRMVEQVDKQLKDQDRDLHRERCSGTSTTISTTAGMSAANRATSTPTPSNAATTSTVHRSAASNTGAHSSTTADVNAAGTAVTTTEDELHLEDILPAANTTSITTAATTTAVSNGLPRPTHKAPRDANTHAVTVPALPGRDFWADFHPPLPPHQPPHQPLQHQQHPQPTVSRSEPSVGAVGSKRKAGWSSLEQSLFQDQQDYQDHQGTHLARTGGQEQHRVRESAGTAGAAAGSASVVSAEARDGAEGDAGDEELRLEDFF